VHPLVGRVRQALGQPGPLEQAYLRLLAERFERLEACAAGQAWSEPRSARALARRFLRPREGSWHDGDENLVRGPLDGFTRGEGHPERALARGLLEVAAQLAAIEARPETLWFFLWELESLLPQESDGKG